MDLRVREVTVGSIVIVAILVFIFGTMWLSGRRVSSGNTVRMQFANVSGLKRASPVRVSGVNVGKVESIEFMDVGKVLVAASLPPKIHPKVDASAQIVSVTLVGDYAIDFDPGQSGQVLPPGRVILGSAGPGAERPGRGARRPGRQRAARRAADREPADRRPALRHAGGAAGHPQGDPADDGGAERHPQRADRRADADHGHVPLAQRAARQHAGQPGAGPDARPGGHAHRQPGRDDGAAHRRRARGSTPCSRGCNSGRGTIGKFATDSGLYTDIRDLSQSMKKLLDELPEAPGQGAGDGEAVLSAQRHLPRHRRRLPHRRP